MLNELNIKSKGVIVKDLYRMLLFGALTILFSFISFQIPGLVETGRSNLVEIPLLISVFHIQNPLFLLGTVLIGSIRPVESNLFLLNFLIHAISILISWIIYKLWIKNIANQFLKGVIWFLYIIGYYYLLLIPTTFFLSQILQFSTSETFIDFVINIGLQTRFELIATALTTTLYTILLGMFKELKTHKQNLELLVDQRTRELVTTNKKLEETIVTKDKFFKIIGHDLRGPMAQIIQMIEIIETKLDAFSHESILDLLKMLKENSKRGFDLLENLMHWARSQTQTINFDPQNIDLNELINENIDLLLKDAQSKKITIRNNIEVDTIIYGDKDMLNTIFRNLLSNAIKFTMNGGVIEITAKTSKKEITVSVKDSGVGMTNEIKENLFRIDKSQSMIGTDNEKGTGIGLILCKEFIERHHGKINVESELNSGSTFHILIPKSVP